MDFAKLAAERYSLRKFSDRPVEAEKLSAVLEAGRNAPTAHNLQPQRIFVLQSSEALEKVDGCTGAHFHPPVMLLVAYDPEAAWKREDDGKNHGEIDAAIAVTQMMLQAADLGLGTTYVGMFDPEKLHERGTYQQPRQTAEGMTLVLVNGQAAVRDGQLTGVMAGRAIRR